MLTAQSIVERSLAVHRSRVAVVDGERVETYANLADRSARLAHVLLDAGASAARPAATFLPNRLEFIEVDVACTRAGITRVGVSDRLSADECRYILADTGAPALVATPALFDSLGDDLPETLEKVLLVEQTHPRARGSVVDYEVALSAASGQLTAAPVDPLSPNYILYTSGTTGRPKGATHSHAARAHAMLNMLAAEISIGIDSGMVHAGPVTHGSGSKILAFIAAGGRNIIMRRFDLGEFVVAAGPPVGGTHTFLVPTMLQRLLEAGDDVAAAVAGLEQISFGGSPISAALFRRAIETFGANLTQVYGSCEAPHPVTLLRPSDYLAADCSDEVLTSAGRVSHAVEIRLVDDDGNDVARGDAGELLVRSPHLMLGYWRNPEATASVFTSDGWYRAGDVATADETGLVTFQDRKRDIIITGGLNVYPSEVERVIETHPGVHQVAVVGAPDDEWGEAVVAYVVRADGQEVTSDEIITWARSNLASYKKPRQVMFLESMPLGSSNKILKDKLRDPLWAGQTRRVS